MNHHQRLALLHLGAYFFHFSNPNSWVKLGSTTISKDLYTTCQLTGIDCVYIPALGGRKLFHMLRLGELFWVINHLGVSTLGFHNILKFLQG